MLYLSLQLGIVGWEGNRVMLDFTPHRTHHKNRRGPISLEFPKYSLQDLQVDKFVIGGLLVIVIEPI